MRDAADIELLGLVLKDGDPYALAVRLTDCVLSERIVLLDHAAVDRKAVVARGSVEHFGALGKKR